MNRLIISIFIISFPLKAMGQMFPLSDHYEYNALSINPAFAGCQDALSATLLYRNQWVGFKDAPKNQMLSVHVPYDHDRIGLGLVVEKNSIGIYRETSFTGNYAYRTELYTGRLALGIGFGATAYHNAWNELDASDEGDEQLVDNAASSILPSFSLGMYYYTKKYYIGFSLPRFLSHEPDEYTGKFKLKNKFSEYNYIITGGSELGINSWMKLVPSLLIKYHPRHAVQIDYSANVSISDRIWIGMGYRSRDMLIGMLQCRLNYQLKMAYSYDFDLGTMGKFNKGSHEIGLNYIFRYERNVMGPRQF